MNGICQIDADPRLLEDDELDAVSGGKAEGSATWGGVAIKLDNGGTLYIRYSTIGGPSIPLVSSW